MLAIRKHCFSDNKSARNRQARGIYFIHLKKKKKTFYFDYWNDKYNVLC